MKTFIGLAGEEMSEKQSAVSGPIRALLSDDQDPAQVEKTYLKVSEILTPNEVIEYIAVQKPLMALTPDSIVLTNRRFIVYRPKVFGRVDFTDYIWRDLSDAKLKHGVITSTLSMRTLQGGMVVIDSLPKKQASRVYAVAQEREERAREERRQRDLEEKRAAAGQHVTNLSAAPVDTVHASQPVVDPVERLRQLRTMLDDGLIDQGEYNAKKAEILSRM
jgi:hypothetical protein